MYKHVNHISYVNNFIYNLYCKQIMIHHSTTSQLGELIWLQDCLCETRTEKHLRAKNRTRLSISHILTRARPACESKSEKSPNPPFSTKKILTNNRGNAQDPVLATRASAARCQLAKHDFSTRT